MNIIQLNDALVVPGDHSHDHVRELRRRYLSNDGNTRHQELSLVALRRITVSELLLIISYLKEHTPDAARVLVSPGMPCTFIKAEWSEPVQ